MTLDLSKVHEFAKVPGTQEIRLVRTRPAVRVSISGAPPLFVQDGHVYGAGGDPMPTPPAWFWAEAVRVQSVVAQETGLADLLRAHATPEPSAPVEATRPVPSGWTCPECGKAFPSERSKTFHLMKHQRP